MGLRRARIAVMNVSFKNALLEQAKHGTIRSSACVGAVAWHLLARP